MHRLLQKYRDRLAAHASLANSPIEDNQLSSPQSPLQISLHIYQVVNRYWPHLFRFQLT